MVTEEQLREALHGESDAVQAAFWAWYYSPNGFPLFVDQMIAALDRIRQVVGMTVESLESLAAAIQDIVADTLPTQPRKGYGRPPRYAGPANKGRSWTRQPPRVARSNCPRPRK